MECQTFKSNSNRLSIPIPTKKRERYKSLQKKKKRNASYWRKEKQ